MIYSPERPECSFLLFHGVGKERELCFLQQEPYVHKTSTRNFLYGHLAKDGNSI